MQPKKRNLFKNCPGIMKFGCLVIGHGKKMKTRSFNAGYNVCDPNTGLVRYSDCDYLHVTEQNIIFLTINFIKSEQWLHRMNQGIVSIDQKLEKRLEMDLNICYLNYLNLNKDISKYFWNSQICKCRNTKTHIEIFYSIQLLLLKKWIVFTFSNINIFYFFVIFFCKTYCPYF